jgi:SAM-dependent methyltransferase
MTPSPEAFARRLPGLAERARAPLSPAARLRYDVIARLLGDLPAARSFMEVGCGQGALGALLALQFHYVGYEPDPASFAVARARVSPRGGRVLHGPAPAVPDRLFDVVGAFEVLEHQEDDRAMLASWVRWVRPGGHLLVSVPAHPHRYGAADHYVGHFRRYSRDALRTLLDGEGLIDIRLVTYGFPLGHALEWGRNRVLAVRAPAGRAEERTLASGRRLQPGAPLAPAIWALTMPFQYLQRPFADTNVGTGIVVRAQRPPAE